MTFWRTEFIHEHLNCFLLPHASVQTQHLSPDTLAREPRSESSPSPGIHCTGLRYVWGFKKMMSCEDKNKRPWFQAMVPFGNVWYDGSLGSGRVQSRVYNMLGSSTTPIGIRPQTSVMPRTRDTRQRTWQQTGSSLAWSPDQSRNGPDVSKLGISPRSTIRTRYGQWDPTFRAKTCCIPIARQWMSIYKSGLSPHSWSTWLQINIYKHIMW